MKKLFLIIASCLICAWTVCAQSFDPEHRHSVELSTGLAPVQLSYYNNAGAGSGFSFIFPLFGIAEELKGDVFFPSVNIGYNYALSETWDLNVVVNTCAMIQPNGKNTLVTGPVVTPMVDFRWKWLRGEKMRLYSSFGVGCMMMDNFKFVCPYPYLTPIGINFGKGRVYGLAELNFSNAATYLLVGAGIRF